MKVQWIIFGIIGLVVLWLISRMSQASEPQVVAEFIGAPEAESGASQADAQMRLGVFQTLASLAQSANEAISQRSGVEAQLEATRLSIAADRELGLRQIEAQEGLFLEDLRNRAEQTKLHLSAVQKAAQEFRGKALERQGTILNAIGQAFGVGRPYDYVSAFGGARPAPWYAPITQGLGQLISRAGISVGF